MVPDTEQRARVADFQRRHRLALLTIVFTDMVDSMQLKQTLGDHAALGLIERHHRLLRECLAQFPDAEEIEYAGDSFLLVFARPSDAVQFALLFQHGLRAWDGDGAPPLRDRIGIHVGEVLMAEDATRLVGGIQIDACSRLMALGGADQILLSRFSFDSARQALRGVDVQSIGALSWLNHGHYLFKGLDEPMEVCEVGETGLARLAAPPNTPKAHRCATPDGEPVLGWRPAVGQQVPGTSWRLERNLGAGGFGEVWLGTHAVLKQQRVFKFCFRADRVRSLKREVTIFRLLRERVGEHPHIVTVHDVYFDEPPFYLVMDYVEGAALPAWAEAHGGLTGVPLATRLEIVAQVADALQAAHDAGVIHRDVKPSNILLGGSATAPAVKLADFGIGQVISAEALGGITQLGFTQTMVSKDSYSGTQLYLSPELLGGQPATTRSDIYSLGVVLFQMIAGDFSRPLTTDWADAIDDPLLREDLQQCFASDPRKRFAGASALATRLRTLPQRRAALAEEEARRANAERLAYRRGWQRAAALALAVLGVIASLAVLAWWQAGRARESAAVAGRERDRAEQARTRLELDRAEALLAADDTPGGLAFLANIVRRDPLHPVAVPRLMSALCDRSHALPVTDPLAHEKLVVDAAFSPDGRLLATSTPETTRIWDAATGRLVAGPLPFGGYRVTFTPDGSRLVVMKFDARIFDAQTGATLAELDANPGEGGGDSRPDAILSPGGRTLLTISARPEALLWDVASGQRLAARLAAESEIRCAQFSADGQRIVTGEQDGSVVLWDARSGERLGAAAMSGPVTRVAWPAAGRRFATGSTRGEVTLWDGERVESRAHLSAHGEAVTDLSFSPDGLTLFSTSEDGTGRFWDAVTGAARGELPVTTRFKLWSGRYSADGLRLLTRTGEGIVCVRDPTTFEFVVDPIRPSGAATVAVFSADDRRVATGSSDGTARIWTAEISAAQPLPFCHGAVVRDAAWSGGDHLVTAGNDGFARLWDGATGSLRRAFHARGSALRQARHSAAANRLLAVAEDHRVWLWDAQSGESAVEPIVAAGPVAAAEFAPVGNAFFVAIAGGAVRVYDAGTGKPIGAEFGGKVSHACWSGDGRAIVIAAEDQVAIWDPASGQPLGAAAVHRAKVGWVAASAQGDAFVTGSFDGSARTWESATGRARSSEMPHGNVVSAASFSADGALVITTSYDRVARLWDAHTGAPLPHALPHSPWTIAARFAANRPRLAITGGLDGTARLWDVASGHALAEPLEAGAPARLLESDAAGRRVLVLGDEQSRAAWWPVRDLPRPCPAWVADWAEAVGGQRLDESGALRPVPAGALRAIRETARASGGGEYAALAEWFFAPPEERAAAPAMPGHRHELAEMLASAGTPAEAYRALQLSPRSARAWARFALLPHRDSDVAGDAGAEAGRRAWAAERALALDAREPLAWLARALALESQRDFVRASEALDRAAALAPGSLPKEFEFAQSRILSKVGRHAEGARASLAARGIPARDPQATERQIDLSAHYNCRLDEDPIPGDEGNTLEELPRGLQTLAAVEWDIRGMVQLGNRDRLRRFPLTVTGIPVNAPCKALHFLHAAEFVQVPAGVEIGRYVVRYTDGTHADIPLQNGREIADWWGEPVAPLEPAWRGANRLTRQKNGRLNLFKTTWQNPRPEVPVATLDLVSAGTAAAPFVVAISRE